MTESRDVVRRSTVGRRVAPILVGVGERAGSTHAVCWAAREAALRRRPLRLVHARTERFASVLASGMFVPPPLCPAPDRAAPVIDVAVELARSVDPAIEITTCTRTASPAHLLVSQGYVAPMLVLGNSGASVFEDVLAGSICGTVVAQAPCPVVAVSRRAVWPDAPIVVGITDADTAVHAIEFGFELADRRCVPLTLHLAGRGPRHARRLSAAIGRVTSARGNWHRRYPRVAVTWQESWGDPVHALGRAAGEAQLLVVGAPRCGPTVGLVTRSVGHALLRTPPCPLAVIPPNWLPTPLEADGTR